MENDGNGKKEAEAAGAAESAGPFLKLVRLALCVALGVGIGLLGLAHYKTRRDEARRAAYKPVSSGGYVERVDPIGGAPSRSELDLGGVKCQIERGYMSAPPEIALDNYAARKAGLGWSEVKPADRVSARALADPMSPSRYFLTPDGRIAGVRASKKSSGTKILTVELDPLALASGSGAASPPSPAPDEYLALMPAPPKLAYRPVSAGGAELYVCSMGADATPAGIARDIRGRLSANGWEADIPEDLSNLKTLENKNVGTVISARKAGVLCNIIITRRESGSVAAFRFSNLRRADIGR